MEGLELREVSKRRGGAGALVALAALGALAVAAQVAGIPQALGTGHPINASGAVLPTALNALAALAIVAWALVAPARLRFVAVAATGGAVLLVLVVGAVGAARGVSMVSALLILAACWEVGERALRVTGAERLAALVPAAWLAGAGLLAVALTLLGRAGLLRWWTAGIPVAALGVAGLARLARRGRARRQAVWAAVVRSPLSVACAALVCLCLGWTAIFTCAPEMGIDAHVMKAWLPQFWARTGEISVIEALPFINLAGASSVLAVPGHLLTGPDTGRWMQWFVASAIVVTVWWWGRGRGAVGPLAGLAAGTFPLLVFQGATGYDDLLLSFGAIAITLATLRTLDEKHTGARARVSRPVLAGLAMGLLCGALVALKLHLFVFALVISVGWALAAGPRGGLLWRFGGLVCGAVLAGGLPLLLRAIDYGNPVFPSYNALFRSPAYLPVNETYGLPYWGESGAGALLALPWEAVRHGSELIESAGANPLGLLLPALLGAALVAGPALRDRGGRVVWIAVFVAVVAWWIELRNLRLLLPELFAALVVLCTFAPGIRVGRGAERVLMLTAALLWAAALPSGLAAFTRAPERAVPFSAAVGLQDDASFERTVFPVAEALEVFNRRSAPDARVVSTAWQRTFVHGNRLLVTAYEAQRLLQRDRRTLADGAATRRALAAMGVGWVLVDDTPWARDLFADLLAETGERVFAAGGWSLYRLERPLR